MSISKKLTSFSVFASVFLLPVLAFAQDASKGASDGKYWIPVGAGLAVGLGAIGGTLGQGRAASAALEGIARNPNAAGRIQTPMILGLALIESLVLVAFGAAYLLIQKL